MQLNELGSTTKICQQLATAWAAWRGDKIMPARADMQLEDIVEILPWITIVDVISETELTFRLAGTMIREVMGIELTGRNLLEITEPEYQAARGAGIVQIAHKPCGVVWIWNIAFQNQDYRPAEILSLPVRSNKAGQPVQLLSVMGLLGRSEMLRAMDHLQQLAPSELASFIDIGAGIPPARN